jgi:hypothetical protein
MVRGLLGLDKAKKKERMVVCRQQCMSLSLHLCFASGVYMIGIRTPAKERD